MNHMVNTVRVVALVLAAGLAAACGTMSFADSQASKATEANAAKPSAARLAAVQVRVAEAALEQKDPNTALAMFERAHRTAPDEAGPLFGKGGTLMALRRYGEAATAFRAALALAPDNVDAREELGKALVSEGKYAEGLREFEIALAKRRSASLLNKIGVAHELLGNGDDAQLHYREALVLEPENLSARNNLALSLAVSGDYDNAIAEMERVAASPDASDRYRRNLAFVYGLAGRDDTMPAVARSAADSGWDKDFFQRVRDMAESGDRSSVLAMLSQPTDPTGSQAGRSPPSRRVTGTDRAADTAAKTAPAPALGTQPAARPYVANPLARSLDDRQRDWTAKSGSPQEWTAKSGTPLDKAGTAAPATPADEDATAEAEPDKSQATQLAMRTPPAAATPPTVVHAAAPADDGGVYRIQLGAYRETKHLPTAMAGLNKAASDILPGGRVEVLFHKRLYQIRSLAVPERNAARELCGTLRQRKVDCFITRHSTISDRPAIEIASAGDADAVRQFITKLPWRRTVVITAPDPTGEAPSGTGSAMAVPDSSAGTTQQTAMVSSGGAGDVASPGSTSGPAASAGINSVNSINYRVQLGAYRKATHLKRALDALTRKAGELMPPVDFLAASDGAMTGGSGTAGAMTADTTTDGAGPAGAMTTGTTTDGAAKKGVRYRLRSKPLESRAAAATLCEALRQKGVECLVIRHNNKRWRVLG